MLGPHNVCVVYLQMCVIVNRFMVAQVACLLAQDRWGPRCIIPRRVCVVVLLSVSFLLQFRPQMYDYHVANHELDMDVDCVICMSEIPAGISSTDRMTAPCGHVFHTACLERWLAIKLECPSCRRSLPPVRELD